LWRSLVDDKHCGNTRQRFLPSSSTRALELGISSIVSYSYRIYSFCVIVDLLYKVTFSDTALGRLLLAIEFYILIVSTMVFTFYSSEPTSAPLSLRDKRASSFVGLHVSKIDADQGLAGEDDANTTGSPRPTVQRALSWLSWSGNASQRLSSQFRPSYEDGGQPRSEEAAERGVISSPSDKRVPLAVPDDIQPSSVNSSNPDHITQRIFEGFPLSTTQLPADTVYGNGRPSTTMSATTTTSPDSPILGADGIAEAQGSNRASRKPREPGYSSTTSSQLSGYEDLLREQDQLERSIAALKTVFEQGRSEGRRRDESSNTNTVSRLSGRSRLRESSTTAYGPTSASNRSDFSLSIFPEPPEQGVTENLSTIRPRSSSVPALTPTQISFGIGRSFPVSTAGIDGVAVLALGGMESVGTHYDVTSFIGGASAMFPFGRLQLNYVTDLTLPEQQSAAQVAMYLRDSDTESETGSADLATIVTAERRPSNAVLSRPKLVEKTSLRDEAEDRAYTSRFTPARPYDHSASRPADTPTRNSPTSNLGTSTSPAVLPRLPSPRPLTLGGRAIGLPPRPKPKLDVKPAR
jgi:hypothetical protein